MHRVRQLILAGTQPPECFVPATAEIAQEMAIANALVLYHSAADYRDYARMRRNFAVKGPEKRAEWGAEIAPLLHQLRAFG